MTQAEPAPPLVPFLKRSAAGAPYLAGSKCQACGHVFVGERQVCAKCTARGQMLPVHLAETGTVYVYTIVHRSFPGVKTPFIDAIVDLDDGSHLKGTLLRVAPEPAALPFDMRVKIIYHEVAPINADDRPAGGQSAGGQPYLTYAFVPA
jgi:uncharacterized OB-fold protein